MQGDWTKPDNDADGNPIRQTSLADVPRSEVTRLPTPESYKRRRKGQPINGPMTWAQPNVRTIRAQTGFGAYDER